MCSRRWRKKIRIAVRIVWRQKRSMRSVIEVAPRAGVSARRHRNQNFNPIETRYMRGC